MHKGKLIAVDSPTVLKDVTKKGEVLDVIVRDMTGAQVNALRSVNGVGSLSSEVQDSVIGQTHLRLRLENMDDLPSIFDFFFKEKIKLVNFKQEEPTLEDAFIELTGQGISE